MCVCVCIYVYIYIYNIFFVDECLHSFHILVFVNNAAISTGVSVVFLVNVPVSFFLFCFVLDVYPKVEMLGDKGSLTSDYTTKLQ